MNIFQLYQEYNQNLERPFDNQKAVFNLLKDYFQVSNYSTFRKDFRVSKYEALRAQGFCKREKECSYYVRTSGTNSPAKFIPISPSFLRKNHQRASEYMLYNLVMNHTCVSLLMGKNLAITGYKYSDSYLGKEVFDISALMFHLRPKIYQSIGYPKGTFYNWKEKLQSIEDNFSSIRKIRSLSGVPTWMISLFKHLEYKYQKPIHILFPHLQYIVHGGVKFDHYFPIFQKAFPDRELRFFEVYNSTEAFHGFQLNEDKKDLLLCTNTGVFYEFKNGNDVRPIWDIETGMDYELLITNEDGLVRYQTGDLIRFNHLQPMLFEFRGRTSEYLNAFGEDLEIAQTNKVITKLNKELGLDIIEYIVLPKYSQLDKLGRHEWYLFLDQFRFNSEEIARHIDKALKELNNNYQQKRTDSVGMLSPEVHLLPVDAFRQLIDSQNKNTLGQAKIKKLNNDRDIIKMIQKLPLQPSLD